MWQKDTICNVNSNFPVLYNTSSIPFLCNSSRPIQPQLQLAMNWFRLIQQIRSMPQTNQMPQLPPGIPFLEKRPKHQPSKLLYHYDTKLTQFHEKMSKSKSNPCRFLSTKEKTKSKSLYGNKFLTTFKITSDCHNNLSRIPNKIGPFECKLCGTLYSGAVQLANHRCPQILRIEHRCPDCHKVYICKFCFLYYLVVISRSSIVPPIWPPTDAGTNRRSVIPSMTWRTMTRNCV